MAAESDTNKADLTVSHNVPHDDPATTAIKRERKRNALLSFSEGQKLLDRYQFPITTSASASHHVEPLGRGGSGVVFLVEQSLYQNITVKRAIKFYVLRDDIAGLTAHQRSAPISSSDFLREIKNLSAFNQENLLKVIEAGLYPVGTANETLEIPYIVTDFVDGPTLKDCIADGSLAREIEGNSSILIELILQICRGLAYLHNSNFYHCDIAPKNMFLRGSLAEPQLVIGDFGIGRTLPPNSPEDDVTRFFLAGSKDYCPPEVARAINTEVTQSFFRSVQPRWDIFAAAKSAIEIIASLGDTPAQRPAWFDAVNRTLREALTGRRFKSVKQLAQRIQWLHPMEHTTWEVPELSDNASGTHRSLLPIEPVVVSPRIRDLMHHPAVLRLKRVPQLVMASRIFHGGNHNRYEHSLGVYQNTRHYLQSLLSDDHFLSFFDPEYVGLALVCALFCNITRFPFSTIVHEIHSKDKELFADFSRINVLTELLGWTRVGTSETLEQEILQSFPRIDISMLKAILAEGPFLPSDPAVRFIKYLLNSSIDARIIDYIRRDSHHLGLYKGDAFEIHNLLPHIRFRDGEMVIKSSGLTVVEEIVTLRYWLFNRIYWNKPNRTMIAMIRWVLLSLRSTGNFLTTLREHVLNASEDTVLKLLCDEADRSNLSRAADVCRLLMPQRPNLFEELLQFNRAEGEANAAQFCSRYESLSVIAQMELHQKMNAEITRICGSSPERQHVLIDLPVEPGLSKKLGEDINVLTHTGTMKATNQLSSIVKGVQEGFNLHLQRLRIFVHPETWKALDKDHDMKQDVEESIRGVLRTII